MTRIFLISILFSLVGCDREQAPPLPAATPRTDALLANVDATVNTLADISVLFDVSPALAPGSDLGVSHVSDLQSLYATRGFKPIWLGNDRPLSDTGESLLASLLDAEPVHGLWREDFHLDRIDELLRLTTREDGPATTLDPAEVEALRGWERAHDDYDAEDTMWSQMLRAGSVSPTIAQAIRAQQKERASEREARMELDVRLSDALITFGRQMKWDNSAWTRPVEWSGTLTAAQDEVPQSVKDQLTGVFEDPAKVHQVLAELIPPFEQYTKLTQAFQHYQQIVADGGWEELPLSVKGLRAGRQASEVVALKRRLRAEGFWDGDDSEQFGPATKTAVLSYQRSHQLWEDGSITPETLASLNVPAQRRLNQIRVTLQHWRESRVGRDEDYVQVNIPDFHAEIWENKKLERRLRVVTGAARQKWNPDLKRNELVNATPLISGRMDFVVFNPYWNIPNTIRWDEIEPKAAADPEYLANEHIERVIDDAGREYLRQLPGPWNALGVVKFLFPNNQDIYLHDTPDKGFFKWPTRAFSHGCVRVQDPIDFARWVLAHDGKWDEAAVNSWLARPTETWIKLDKPLPVHIEYYVVRVDELGRTNFLADVYLNDQPRLAEVEARLRARAEKAGQDG